MNWECKACDNLDYLHVQDEDELLNFVMDFLAETECENVVIVADEDLTKKLMYLAINNEYDIDSVVLNPYEYDKGYITTISWNGENYEICVEEAYGDDCFLASGFFTLIQNDFKYKCEYINDVLNNKFVSPDLTIFVIGAVPLYDDEEEAEKKLYSYANKYEEDGNYTTVFVESNMKDFVDIIKTDFEEIFED